MRLRRVRTFFVIVSEAKEPGSDSARPLFSLQLASVAGTAGDSPVETGLFSKLNPRRLRWRFSR